MGLNGGPQFPFTEAISFQVRTEDQAETDRLWDALIADGGEESMCGWLKDRWGMSWQITPQRLLDLMANSDHDRAKRAMQAMMKMRKIDIATLEAAADEELAAAD
jgi:predicted 3-demethylubiquinone-9 3-methyltransferase (glyoxalase superfamily)